MSWRHRLRRLFWAFRRPTYSGVCRTCGTTYEGLTHYREMEWRMAHIASTTNSRCLNAPLPRFTGWDDRYLDRQVGQIDPEVRKFLDEWNRAQEVADEAARFLRENA